MTTETGKEITGAPDIVKLPKNVKPEDITIDSLRHLSESSFALWALRSGAEVDGNKVDFDLHRYLLPIYMDNSDHIVWQKAAQLGATVYMLLRSIWWLKVNQGRKAGLYFPTKEGVELLSQDRLDPLLRSVPDVWNMIQESEKTSGRMALKHIGASSFYLFHLGGKASKDSTPLDFITFDEVRLCNAADIDQALERVSHSPYKVRTFMSTAGFPAQDINKRFLGGTQHVWMSRCGCEDGIDLATAFPNCVVEDPRRPEGIYLRCPKCGWEIKDPQNGRYVAHNPGASYVSYRASQLNSKFISLREIWDFYLQTNNIKEFYNAKLGLPYIDEENQPIKQEHLDAAIDSELRWGEPGHADRTAMGIDQGAGYIMCVIADVNGNSKRIRHVEIVEADNPEYRNPDGSKRNPFVRARELMKEYKVKLCVCDGLPNANDALEFAQDFPGRVFLAIYSKESKQVVQWKDRTKVQETVRKAGPLLRFKYLVTLSRYLSLDLALAAWTNNNVVTPDPRGMVQVARSERTGRFEPEHPLERLHDHLKRLVRQFTVTNEETNEGRMEYVYVGGDPHLAHAWNYCNIALERLRKQVNFVFV